MVIPRVPGIRNIIGLAAIHIFIFIADFNNFAAVFGIDVKVVAWNLDVRDSGVVRCLSRFAVDITVIASAVGNIAVEPVPWLAEGNVNFLVDIVGVVFLYVHGHIIAVYGKVFSGQTSSWEHKRQQQKKRRQYRQFLFHRCTSLKECKKENGELKLLFF